MKKYFVVTVPSQLLFEDLNEAISFAQWISKAKKSNYESVNSDNSRDWRHHYINYTNDIDLNINFSPKDFCESRWESIEKKALYTASVEEINKRESMEKEELKKYIEDLRKNNPDLWDSDYWF